MSPHIGDCPRPVTPTSFGISVRTLLSKPENPRPAATYRCRRTLLLGLYAGDAIYVGYEPEEGETVVSTCHDVYTEEGFEASEVQGAEGAQCHDLATSGSSRCKPKR
jgi:hypothetical protein